MSQTNSEIQTVHQTFGMRMANTLFAAALAIGGGYFFESIFLGIGLYVCFAILFDVLSRAAAQTSSDILYLGDHSDSQELKEGEPLPVKPRRFLWIRRDDRYYVPHGRTPGRISAAAFSLATEGRGPMGVFES